MGLPRLEAPLTLAPGLTLVPLDSSLSVFDLAAAGAVGFREWAMLEPASWSNMTLEPIRCPPKMQPGSPCNLRRSTA
jgi:hypothetical protein